MTSPEALVLAPVFRPARVLLAAVEPGPFRSRASVRAGTGAGDAVQAVDLRFAAAGTTALEDGGPLSYCFRDRHVAAQNMNALPLRYGNAAERSSASTPARRCFDAPD